VPTTLYLLANLLPPLALAAGAELAARRSARLGVGVAAASVSLLVIRAVLIRDPCLEHRVFPWSGYAMVHGWHFFLFPAIVVAVRRRVPRLRTRRALLGVAGLLFAVHAYQAISVASGRDLVLDERVTADGFRLQSTGYSCAAASAANLLHVYGIAATETEMARTSLLSRGRGVHDLGTLRALTLRCASTPWRPALVRLTRAELVAAGRPALVPLRHGFLVNHMVCVLETGPEGIVLLDPAVGRRTLDFAAFDERFLGRALVLEPRRRASPAPLPIDGSREIP